MEGSGLAAILLVEDDLELAETVAILLRRGGYQVAIASTGAEGLAMLKGQTFSLVLLDIMLPDMDGHQVCQSVKRHDPLLPVVIISVRSDVQDKVLGLDAGADDYIVKPVNAPELLARVRAALRIRETELLLARRSQQLQLVNEIGQRIASILDLDNLLWEVIRLAWLAYGPGDLGSCFGVGLLEGEELILRIGLWDYASRMKEQTIRVPLKQLEYFERAVRLGATEVLSKVAESDGDIGIDKLEHFRSMVIVPISRGETVHGVLLAGSKQTARFGEEDRLIMETLAGQLAVAVTNARLVAAQRRETDNLKTLLQVVRIVNRLPDKGEVAQAIVRLVAKLSGAIHSAIILWRQEREEIIQQRIFASSQEMEEALHDLVAQPNFLKMTFKEEEPFVLQQDQSGAGLRKVMASLDSQELLVTPIHRLGQTGVALLVLGEPSYRFDAHDCSLAADIANQVAVAMENATPLFRTQPEGEQPSRISELLPATSSIVPGEVTVLAVEDNPEVLFSITESFEVAGYEVLTTSRGQTALEMVSSKHFDLVLLDIVLPDLDGFQVCERLREFSSVPVIMVTGKADRIDKVRGLNIGADDYLVKPFDEQELLARAQAVLRRAHLPDRDEEQPVLHCGDLTLDFAHRQVLLRGEEVSLSATEYKLLHYLATNAGHVLTHQQLLARIWGPEYRDEAHYLWVSISRLRKKIEDDPTRPRYILTEKGVGYTFVCET